MSTPEHLAHSTLAAQSSPTSVPLLPALLQLPAPTPSYAQSLSVATALASRAAVSLPSGLRRRYGLRSFRRAHKTFSPSKSRAYKADATCGAPPGPRWSCSCGSRLRCRPLLCAFRQLVLPPLLLLPGGCTFAGNRLYARNVFAQTAQFFQTLGLAHLELQPQLEKLIAHLCFLMPKFFVGQVSNFFRLHELSVETLLARLYKIFSARLRAAQISCARAA